jgi:hypothetical protein
MTATVQPTSESELSDDSQEYKDAIIDLIDMDQAN